ncbi:MAG: C4-dicarboxylate ABC transporter, partial [Gammaproteobacteria bacterium]|nr:C4-dicarboxylate ABC transporter [Gammaproteobacteria bacterium]
MNSRRRFVSSGAAVLGAAALGPSNLYAAKPKIRWRMQTYASRVLAAKVVQPAIDSFNRIAGEEMQIELYFADQIVSTDGMFAALQNGTLDAVQSDDDSMASP